MSVNAALREHYKRNFEVFCRNQLKISTRKPGELIPLELNGAQRILSHRIEDQRKRLGYIRYCCCKSRQSTMSTFAQALCFHSTVLTPQFNSLLIANDDQTAMDIFKMSQRFLTHLSPDIRPMTAQSNVREIVFANPDKRKRYDDPGLGSQIVFLSATKITAGTGSTRHAVHLCLRGDALVLLASGDPVPIAQVRPGDCIITHTGARATVKAIDQRFPHTNLVEVRTWMNCEAITLTADHRVWTQRGWVPAGELIPNKDHIGTAVTPIVATHNQLPLPKRVRQRGRGGPKVIEADVILDRAFGWTVGYYLAEGTIGDSHLNRAASITFAHHRSERAYAEQAVAGCREFITSHNTYHHSECLTSTTVVYGSSLAQLFLDEFGRTDDKRIPEWVFEAGREFCEGLVLGYLAGDGSKGVQKWASIFVTSVRVRLLIQLRRLVASLGWGWGSLYRKPAYTDKRGWKCREAWTLGFSGDCARHLRGLLSLEKDHALKGRHTTTQKYRLDDRYIWTRIRSVTQQSPAIVYDIEVDHPDHSFETIVGAVANSELSKWNHDSLELIFSSILPAIHLEPGTIIAKESTAFVGGDSFREMCEDARRGQSDDMWFFIPWFCDTKNVLPLDPGETIKLTLEEKRIEKLAAKGQPKDDVPPVTMIPEQFKWRRKKILELKSETMWEQEYPSRFEDAWIRLDATIFDHGLLAQMKRDLKKPKRFVSVEPGPKIQTVRLGDGRVDVSSGSDYIAIFQEPEKGVTYDIGVDVAVGAQEASDWSVAQVLRRDIREQVAELHLHIDPKDLGTKLYWLGMYYNQAQLIVEMNGPGFATHGQLASLAYPYIYIWRHRERDVPSLSTYRGWKTMHDSKQLMVSNSMHRFNHKDVIVRSRVLWQEMYDYVQIAPGVYRATIGHDDAVEAWMICIQGGEDESFGNDAIVAQTQSNDFEREVARDRALQDDVTGMASANQRLERIIREQRGIC